MTDIPKFHRWIDPADKKSVRTLSIDADDAERAALAAWLDVPAIRTLHADMTVKRTGTDAAEVSGAFAADVDLVCGVSLEVFAQRLSGTISQEFRKPHGIGLRHATAGEIDVSLEDADIGEWRAQGIDLGALLAEELSLAIPDFPVMSGAELEAPIAVADSDERPNPFTALARLKDNDA